jgi:hypothetical protein
VRGYGTAEVAQNEWARAQRGGDVEAERYGRSRGRGCGCGKKRGRDVVAALYGHIDAEAGAGADRWRAADARDTVGHGDVGAERDQRVETDAGQDGRGSARAGGGRSRGGTGVREGRGGEVDAERSGRGSAERGRGGDVASVEGQQRCGTGVRGAGRRWWWSRRARRTRERDAGRGRERLGKWVRRQVHGGRTCVTRAADTGSGR